MLRSYRHFIFAFAGWLSLANAPNPSTNTEQPKAETNQAQPAPTPTPPRVQPVQPIQPAELYRPCQGGQGDYSSDLCAQWQAAKAAREAADWTYWGLWLALVGTIGLLATLFYTRKAVLAAEQATQDADRALEIAERNAGAAMELVRVSQENAKRQLRAYLDFDGMNWIRQESLDEGDQVMVGVSYDVKNYGHTPASNVKIRQMNLINISGNVPRFTSQKSEDLGSIAPTDHVTKNAYFRVMRDVWEAIGRREMTLTVKLSVSYTDDFGDDRTLESSFISNGHIDLGFIEGTRAAT